MPESAHNARDKVMNTALRLFTEKGYFNTSMRDITRESSVSTGSVYHYFKDKQGVALALYESLIERMSNELEQIRQAHETAHDQCRAVVELLFRITDREPEAMTFMLYIKHREFLPSERPVCSSTPFRMMRAMVEEGMARGEIEPRDLMVASNCLFGGAVRTITTHLDGILEKPLHDYLDDVWTCSWRAVAASG